MRQHVDSDSVARLIAADPHILYEIVADVTRTPALSPDIERCEWTGGSSGPQVGARFTATNKFGRGPRVSNRPVVVAADPGREFAFSRGAPFTGTLEWRYRFIPESDGTRVVGDHARAARLDRHHVAGRPPPRRLTVRSARCSP